MIRTTIQRLLAREGVPSGDILCVDDGAKAVHAMDDFKPSVVFLDINMPGMDGVQAARLMLQQNPDLRIIVVSGLERNDKQIVDVVSQGAFEVIRKPVRAEELQAVLRLLDSEETGAGRIR